ncbi:Aste57867_49 [Aphanomyces stellatus]|uniref:Aste57867_49 protein n=1 Tax=Aphanomyces stellatus TaxID=120398 RepID=A0A485K221_9STRA|nr:hypothetical protein As57867_000049 [Aphanomyces stellatus]VFT77275.1 Aste57867_49 [Aphanomyces stellatus]
MIYRHEMNENVVVQGSPLAPYSETIAREGRPHYSTFSRVLMKLGLVFTMAAGAAAASIPFNGWYHCEMKSIDMRVSVSATATKSSHLPTLNVLPTMSMAADEAHHHHHHNDDGRRRLNSYTNYECGEFSLPMCHEEVCHDSRGKTVDVFVKRKLADPAKVKPGTEKVIWLLQGGPGDSSTAMENLMSSVYWELNEEVSVYTMDHRGTGRSSRLTCEAAEAMTSGSIGGTGITSEEYPACIQDLLFQVANHTEAFSVTSAAYDLKKVIEATQSTNEVYVYALSYGTYLVERLMQLESTAIRGYIVDSIVSQSAPDFASMATFSNWDKDVARVGTRFLDMCAQDAFCGAKFNHANVTQLTWDLYAKLDADAATRGVNTCADMVDDLGFGAPSESLRSLFGSMVMSQMYREMIPAMIYRLRRCEPKDVNVLQVFVDKYIRQDARWSVQGKNREDDMLYYSELLYGLIVYSEMWETPTPTFDALYKVFTDGIMGGTTYSLVEQYCAFSGNQDAACSEFRHKPSARFLYQPDKYWNVTAAVPAKSTALLMAGGLDAQTERMYARAQYAAMTGDRRLIEFPVAAHCTTFTTRRVQGGNTCGVVILASYVAHGGDLNAIDTSCMNDIQKLTFDGRGAGWLQYFGTDDAFDGDTSHFAYVQAAAAHDRQRERTHSAVAVSCLAVVAVLAVVVAVRKSAQVHRMHTKQQADVEKTEETSVEGSIVIDEEGSTPGTPPEPVVV